MVLVALLLPVLVLSYLDRGAPQEVSSPYVSEIVVSDRNVSYPLRNVLTFDRRPEEVFVYVAVTEMPERTRIDASVEREGRGSVYSRLFGGGELSVEELEGDLAPVGRGSETVSGVVKLRVRDDAGGERLRSGSYSVRVRMEGRLVASRDFTIGGL